MGDRITGQVGVTVGPPTCELCLLLAPSLLPFSYHTGISHPLTFKINSPFIWVDCPRWTSTEKNVKCRLASQNQELVVIPRAQIHFSICQSSTRRLSQFHDPFQSQALKLFGLTAILRLSLHLTVTAVLGLALSPLHPLLPPFFEALTGTTFATSFLICIQEQPGWENQPRKNQRISRVPNARQLCSELQSFHSETWRVKVRQRLEGKSLLKFLRVSHSSFKTVIFVDAIFGELFGRKINPSYYHL